MSFRRVDGVYARVLRTLKTESKSFSPDEVLDAMSEVHEELAREALAIRDISDLTTEAGVSRYDVDALYRMQGFRRPAEWTEPIEIEENIDKWLNVASIPFTYPQPIKAASWGGYLELYPAPTVSGLIVGVYHYRIPTLGLAFGADPETPLFLDPVLVAGTNAKLLGGGYADIYIGALDRAKSQMMTETSGGLITTEHWSERGF